MASPFQLTFKKWHLLKVWSPIFLGVLFVALCPVKGHAEEKKKKGEEEMIRPPMPVPSSVAIYVDTPERIALQIGGRIREPLVILIRKFPKHGTLGPVERPTTKTAYVTYTPHRKASPGSDSFRFAAQSIDSPVSASAQVDIALRMRPAALDYRREVDFGTVPLGETSTQDIVISNHGGSAASGEVVLKSPWKLEGDPRYSVPGGGQTSLRVVFDPTAPGDFRDRLHIGSSPQDAISLCASAIEPLDWPAKGLSISSLMREKEPATLEFTNKTAVSHTLLFDWPEFVRAPSELALDRFSSASVDVEVSAPPAFSFEGMVSFHSGCFTASFPLVVNPAPSRVELDPASPLDLGSVPLGETARGTLRIRNSGGLAARIRITPPRGLTIKPSAASALIEPGSEAVFEVAAQPEKPGTFSLLLPVESESEALPPLKVKFAASPNSPTTPTPSPPPDSSPTPADIIPRVQECSLKMATTTTIDLEWAIPSPTISGFLIELRTLEAGADGEPQTKWEPWLEKYLEISMQNQTAFAHFRKLMPNSFYYIRISARNAEGSLGPPSPVFRMQTRPSNLYRIPVWIWMPGVLLLTALGWVFANRRVRLVAEDMEARIDKLEK